MNDQELDKWLEERVEQIKASNFGKDSGVYRIFSEQARRNMSQGQMGKKRPLHTGKTKAKMRAMQQGLASHYSETSLKQWSDPAMREKMVKAILAGSHVRPTSAENKLGILIEQTCPGEYKYTGDGSFIIGGLVPDFTNVNGQKKVIEMFGNHWHTEESLQKRIEKLAVFGFKRLVIWESDLSSPKGILQKVEAFNNLINHS